MHEVALAIFLLTYLGVALGEVPGLALDRTGIALLGAIAMVVAGVLTTEEAVLAIDLPTILLLYSLMVVSSQFRLGRFYTHVALAIARHMERPRRFLMKLMLVSAGLSAVLANDIVCLAFTPVLTVALMRAGLNPVPFLLGLALSSNIGSAATIIGNPQNMLIGQVGICTSDDSSCGARRRRSFRWRQRMLCFARDTGADGRALAPPPMPGRRRGRSITVIKAGKASSLRSR